MQRITKNKVLEAHYRFFRERAKWGENNLATVQAEIAWRELKEKYEVQQARKAKK